ncbi:MAG: ribosome maturation factor RimM [Ignavibacteria bacterium]|nr:ribosome maturation factor RimM [Ignavibacteria bacterium]MDP3581985.1 ribosome maturation factor RimM [Ignavibacteria bacterium]
MNDLFLIAEIKSAYGSSGFVVIDSFSDFKDRFFGLKNVFVEIFGNRKNFVVESAKEVDKKIILKFAGFNSDKDVQLLIGKKIFVDQENLVQPEVDNYFIHDLVESEVYRDGLMIGKVEDVLVLPANDVIVVLNNDKKRILIPAIKDFVKEFDAEKKRLDLVNGCELLYDDEN